MNASVATVNTNTLTLADLNFTGQYKVAEDVHTSEALHLEIVGGTTERNRSLVEAVASNKCATTKVLTAIAESIDWESGYYENILKSVAKNKNTPKESLVRLLDHRVASIRVSAVKNPSTPTEAIQEMNEGNLGAMVRTAVEKELARRSSI